MATAPSRLILALPAATIAVAGLGLFAAGRAHPVLGARIRGGPTEGAHTLAFRVEVVERRGGEERPWSGPAIVDLRPLAQPAMQFTGNTNGEGALDVQMSPLRAVQGPVRLRVSVGDGTQSITEGIARVKADAWATRPAGIAQWVAAEGSPIALRAAAMRGAFAVPFEDALFVEAKLGGGGPAPRVALHVVGTGVTPPSQDVVTDDSGRAVLRLTPVEHAASVKIDARGAGDQQGSLTVALPVIPGALHADVVGPCSDNCVLEIASPIPRETAYVAIVTARARVAGSIVALKPDGKGGARGELTLLPLSSDPTWAIVSSESDLRSPSVVGWPIDRRPANEPRPTFEPGDVLWLDGVAPRAAAETARARRVVAKTSRASAALLLLTGGFVGWRVRKAGGTSSWHGVAAVLCLALALALLWAGLRA